MRVCMSACLAGGVCLCLCVFVSVAGYIRRGGMLESVCVCMCVLRAYVCLYEGNTVRMFLRTL